MGITKDEILINKDSSFSDIQLAFNTSYPFLKIEFFINTSGIGINRKKAIDPTTSVSKFLSNHPILTINFKANQTVSEVSEAIKKGLNVVVQVLRKSGSVWLPISLTESWTLESQNAAGEFISIV